MCLPVTPYRVLREWTHAGLACAVTQPREGGSLCGYVRVPPGHPFFGKETTDDIGALDVHGGITLAELEPCIEHEDGQGWWFGFDCAHAWDLTIDPAVRREDLVTEEAQWTWDFYQRLGMREGMYRDEKYVTRHCESLAEQLVAIEQNTANLLG